MRSSYILGTKADFCIKKVKGQHRVFIWINLVVREWPLLYMDRVKRIWYLSPMRAAKVQASLRIHAVSPEPPLLAHRSSESRGTLRQKARSLATLNSWACAVKICHNGMLEDTNSLNGAHISVIRFRSRIFYHIWECHIIGHVSSSFSIILNPLVTWKLNT